MVELISVCQAHLLVSPSTTFSLATRSKFAISTGLWFLPMRPQFLLLMPEIGLAGLTGTLKLVSG